MNKKKSSVVTEFILEQIKSENFIAGDKIPSERELANLLNIGRSSIRESTNSLVDMNILEKRMGIGIFVKKTEFNSLADSYIISSLINNKMSVELLEFRLMLEVQIVIKATETASSDDLQKMETALEMQQKAIIQNKPSIYSDLLFHRAVVTSTKNGVLIKVYDSIADLIRTVREELLIVDPEEKSLNFHKKIYKSIKNRDVEQAEYWMKTHLNDVINRYINLMNGKKEV